MMMQETVEIATMSIEKKVWEVPSLKTLQIIQTFGGGSDVESDYSGTKGPTSFNEE